MKKSNVVSVRLDNKEMEALEIYSKIFNTDKTSTIIKSLLTMNPYLNILKNIIKNLDDKELRLTSLKLDFRNDKDFTNAIDKKIECIDSFRTDILKEIDTQITCISLVHSLIPKEDTYSASNFDEIWGISNNSDSSDLIEFDIDSSLEDLEGDDLINEIEKQNKNECIEMQNRVRSFLKHF